LGRDELLFSRHARSAANLLFALAGLEFCASISYDLQSDGLTAQLIGDFVQSNGISTQDARFPIVRSLCRAALAGSPPNEAVMQQVRRLVESYAAEGADREADAIRQLLEQSESQSAFAPSRLVRSRQPLPGEELTPKTPLPVDRETSSRLVEVLFPEQLPSGAPLFDADIQVGVTALLSEWVHWDALKSLAIQPTHSCLIYGAPGTGKTQLALWMAAQLGLPVVLARLEGLVSSYLGTTSRNIGALFQFANRYRCVLLLDEFDALAKIRDDPQEVGEIKRVVNTLLQSLDSRRELGITIGITNHDQLLDAAVWRRFDIQLGLPRPRFETRLQIARYYLQPLPTSDVQLKLVAWLADGLSGAEIEALARSIKKSAAIEGERFEFLESVRQLGTLHGGRVPPSRREALRQDNSTLAAALYEDEALDFEQKELAQLFGRDPGTISRWLKDRHGTRVARGNN
jgi:hypothetical protein